MGEGSILRFSQEELVYLLCALEIPHLGLISAQDLADLDDDHRAFAFALADRSLRARTVIFWESDERRSVSAPIARLLTAAAAPSYSVALDLPPSARKHDYGQMDEAPSATTPGQEGAVTLLYSLSETLACEWVEAEPGVHQFLDFADVGDMVTRIVRLMDLSEAPAPGTNVSWVKRQALMQAHQLASSDLPAATQLLAQSLPPEAAQQIASSLAHPAALRRLALWRGDGAHLPAPHEMSFLWVLQHDAGPWLLRSRPALGDAVEVLPAATGEVTALVDAFLRPALDVVPLASS